MISFHGGKPTQVPSGKTRPFRNGMGSYFPGLARYLRDGELTQEEEKQLLERLALGEITAAEMEAAPATRAANVAFRNFDLPLSDVEDAGNLMQSWAANNARVQNPVYHFGIGIHPDEKLTESQAAKLIDAILARLGLRDHQAFIVEHLDKSHQHFHVVVNRVGPDFKAWKPSRDKLRIQDVLREYEVRYGMRRVPTFSDPRRRKLLELGFDPSQHLNDILEMPFSQRMRSVETERLLTTRSWREFETVLGNRLLFLEPASRGQGLKLTDGFDTANLSKLDREFSGPRLAERFGQSFREYIKTRGVDPSLDLPVIEEVAQRVEKSLKEVTSKQATFTLSDLRRAVARDPERETILRLALTDPSVRQLASDRFVLVGQIETERALFASSRALAGRRTHAQPSDFVEKLLAAGHSELTEEQVSAVLNATTGDDLSIIIGRAGVGKTKLARPIVEAFRGQGYAVFGAAPTGKAAENLAAETGVRSRTLQSWAIHWNKNPENLPKNSAILVDEAGLADSPTMAAFLETAKTRGVKVILIGDQEQLKPVGPGDPLPKLIELHPDQVTEVSRIWRQRVEWQRKASELFPERKTALALETYRSHGHIKFLRSNDLHARLLTDFTEHHYLHPEEGWLLLAHRNADVAAITDSLRDGRKAIGELQGPATIVNGHEFIAGDRILFRSNDHSGYHVHTVSNAPLGSDGAQGVKNGTLGEVLDATPERFLVRLDDQRTVEFDPRAYFKIEHGYASTIHRSQGLTADRVALLASQSMDRNLTYVGMTRHRNQVDIYAGDGDFPSFTDLQQTFSRGPRLDLAIDHLRDGQSMDAVLQQGALQPDAISQLLPPAEPPMLTPSPAGGPSEGPRWGAAGSLGAEPHDSLATAVARWETELTTLPDTEAANRAWLSRKPKAADYQKAPLPAAETQFSPPRRGGTLPNEEVVSSRRPPRLPSPTRTRDADLVAELSSIQVQRRALPYEGRLAVMEKALTTQTEQLIEKISAQYRDPGRAAALLRTEALERGADRAIGQVETRAIAYGQPRGTAILGIPSPERRQALETLQQLGGAASKQPLRELRSGIETARHLNARSLKITMLRDRLPVQAAAQTPDKLTKELRVFRRALSGQRSPTKAAVQSALRIRKITHPGQAGVTLAKLAAPELALLLTATQFAITVVRSGMHRGMNQERSQEQ